MGVESLRLRIRGVELADVTSSASGVGIKCVPGDDFFDFVSGGCSFRARAGFGDADQIEIEVAVCQPFSAFFDVLDVFDAVCSNGRVTLEIADDVVCGMPGSGDWQSKDLRASMIASFGAKKALWHADFGLTESIVDPGSASRMISSYQRPI